MTTSHHASPLSANQPPLDIAVIGGGVAGLGAAWLLSHGHRVTVYEKENRLGGHSNTVEVTTRSGKTVPVDTGFIVYNEQNYPNLTRLFAHLGVATQRSDMSFAASIDDGRLEYSGTNLRTMVAQPGNLVKPRFWRMLNDIRRFFKEAPSLLTDPGAARMTLGQFLSERRYSEAFIDDHLLPMAAAIWSSSPRRMRDYPLAAFVAFFENHGLLRVSGRPQWRTVTGGSREYVRRLTAPFASSTRPSFLVHRLRRVDSGIEVVDRSGATVRHDRAIVATHADQALAMLDDPSPDEQRTLGAFRYQMNEAVLHGDESIMPRRRTVWSSWNYLSRAATPGDRRACVTYWMNRLQNIDPAVPLFVTLNPYAYPRSERVYGTFRYAHPQFDRDALAAQSALHRLQGQRGTWFAGSYFGSGFHEDALSSGLDAAEQAGGLQRPWRLEDDPVFRSAAE